VLGRENIPTHGPFVLVINHYHRPGFGVWWLALAVSSALTMPHTWITASGWTAPGKWYEPLKQSASSALFRRLSKMYGLLAMPPMPPRPKETFARADSVRAALAYVREREQAVVCIAPEGRDPEREGLGWPPSGVGRFLLLLAAGGMSFLPAGGWEEGGLVVRFGAPYRLPETRGGRSARDRETSAAVMRSIACLLPEHLRGEFA